jgi:hypothetical protein
MDDGVPIHRESNADKEFALQDWVKARLDDLGIPFTQGGRNSFPDFPLDDGSEGFEVKGLATHTPKGRPGRIATYDSNSHVPTGMFDGRTIYSVFARYPHSTDPDYPVHDLVICHGDFLNPQSDYIHENKSLKTFGGYGDIMIRDRKMYVVRTPYRLAHGLTNQRTLIVPSGDPAPKGLVAVGALERTEADLRVIGYRFDLQTNELIPDTEPNPTAGTVRSFTAYRIPGEEEPVSMVADAEEPPDSDDLAEALELDDE